MIGSLCSGYGGLDMAAQAVFGGDLAWWSDIHPAARRLGLPSDVERAA